MSDHDDQDFGDALPTEEDYLEESELEEEAYDFGPSPSIFDEDEDEEDEEEEDEEDSEDEESSFIEIEEEPYPDKTKEPWPLDRAEEHFYQVALLAVLKDQGINVNSQRDVDEALNAAWKNNPREMQAFENRLRKDAKAETERYKKTEYDPWHEQYENARIAEEFTEVLEHFPEVIDYIEEMKVIGPKFFEENPKYRDSPTKALPILLKICRHLGKLDAEDDVPTPKKRKEHQSFTVEKGRRSRPAPSKGKGKTLLSGKIDNPGDWVMNL